MSKLFPKLKIEIEYFIDREGWYKASLLCLRSPYHKNILRRNITEARENWIATDAFRTWDKVQDQVNKILADTMEFVRELDEKHNTKIPDTWYFTKDD